MRPSNPRPTSPSHDSLLQAATEVFMEVGYAGARVDEIARRAAANKAMIYYHFRSKKGLYKAVLAQVFADLLAEVARLEQEEPDPRLRLRGLYTRFGALFAERPALPQIMLHEVLSGGKGMDAEAARAFARIIGFVVAAVEQGQASGEFRPVDPLLTHVAMLGPLLIYFASGSFRQRILPDDVRRRRMPRPEDLLAHLMDTLERTLAPSPGPGRARPARQRERS